MTHQLYERDLGSLYLDFARPICTTTRPLSP